MSVKIFLVMGSTGEYSDRYEWPVGAYLNEAAAREHADLAAFEAKRLHKSKQSKYASVEEGANKYDPTMNMSYTGTDYYVMTTEMLDAIPGIDNNEV